MAEILKGLSGLLRRASEQKTSPPTPTEEEILSEMKGRVILERDGKSQLTLERLTDARTSDNVGFMAYGRYFPYRIFSSYSVTGYFYPPSQDAMGDGVGGQGFKGKIIEGERVRFLGDSPEAIERISICRSVRRITQIDERITSSPDWTAYQVVAEDERGCDFGLSNPPTHFPNDIDRNTYYDSVVLFSDGSQHSRDVPLYGERSFIRNYDGLPFGYATGGSIIPFHGIDKPDWEDIKRILDIVSANATTSERILHQNNVAELLRRMKLIVEKGPNLDHSPKPNTTSVTLRFG